MISHIAHKSSSPTPNHLKNLKLSLLDQLSPPVYISLIFFYEADELKGLIDGNTDHAQICQHLKQSLSNTLTLFYPLAGKIDPDNFTIDCNDNGVEFIEARAQARLKDILHDPKLDQFQQYLPVDPLGGIYRGEGTLFMLQINFFDCGGIAIGACISHIVADGSSLVEFMNAWASTCRGQKPKPAKKFGVMANYFPARDLSDSNISPSILMGNDKLVTKRFVFDKEKLSALKQEATGWLPNAGSDHVKDPTRVEVVSAFIWKHFIEKKLFNAKKSLAAHVVNIRSRANASLEMEHAFGNGYFLAAAYCPDCDEGSRVPQLHELVSELRRAIRRVDYEYVQEAQDEDRYLSDLGELSDLATQGEVEAFVFSSWCRFPFYEVDFGWGRPVWVCTTALLLNNLAILMSTRSGDGIETWINLLPDKVEAFENEFKLIGTIN
ncbi:hypothetical protein DH2020_025769 [Rehmannia glutinosa]|uniref:Vinorine synthase n=1 Tax=Rehmannia glutinosa TaxID=99300 RepID=A0ABR0VYV8_REHGL